MLLMAESVKNRTRSHTRTLLKLCQSILKSSKSEGWWLSFDTPPVGWVLLPWTNNHGLDHHWEATRDKYARHIPDFQSTIWLPLFSTSSAQQHQPRMTVADFFQRLGDITVHRNQHRSRARSIPQANKPTVEGLHPVPSQGQALYGKHVRLFVGWFIQNVPWCSSLPMLYTRSTSS